ncbi:MAG: chitobiase/beta-hexosaminidase C-terminal domain-containing protein [Terracidiphilus sp.]|jgi:uncharacterized repeat protein (TIGR02543 family)
MMDSSSTTVSYALASNPGVNCTGTMLFPDIRQFDEGMYQNDLMGDDFILSTSTTGMGTGSASGCAGSYASGTPYACAESAGSGSTFAGWSVSSDGTGSGATYPGNMPSANRTVTATFNLPSAAATPTFSPEAGTCNSAQTVTISDAKSGATIYYTSNGLSRRPVRRITPIQSQCLAL